MLLYALRCTVMPTRKIRPPLPGSLPTGASWAPTFDPDELLGADACVCRPGFALGTSGLGTWLEQFRSHPAARNTLVVFLSPRGYPLGEHRQVGRIVPDLYGGVCSWRGGGAFPTAWEHPPYSGAGLAGRSFADNLRVARLACRGTADGGHSLLPLARWEQFAVREAAVLTTGPDQWALRTPAWHLVASGAGDAQSVELYAKPGDRYEVNDVFIRAPEIAAGLAQEFAGEHARLRPRSSADWIRRW